MTKAFKLISMVLVGASLSGCGILLPKNVEFFQDKVKAFPEIKASEKEIQRQAAARASIAATQTLMAALHENSSPSVVAPATDTAVLTKAVSVSVGTPLSPSTLPAEDLAVKLDTAGAKLAARVDSFKKDNNENAGKKIEGSGFFQIGYFSMWAIILAGLAVVWVALKIYGTINPVVGLGLNTAGRVSAGVLRKGFTELSEGGEWFKDEIAKSHLTDEIKAFVTKTFIDNHMAAQSRDTQTLVEKLTK